LLLCATINFYKYRYDSAESSFFIQTISEPEIFFPKICKNKIEKTMNFPCQVYSIEKFMVEPNKPKSITMKHYFHQAWSPDSLPTAQAIQPLIEYLDTHLSALNSALLTKNFHRCLNIIRLLVLKEISEQMDQIGEKPTNFHEVRSENDILRLHRLCMVN
jgi:hypothetical protein